EEQHGNEIENAVNRIDEHGVSLLHPGSANASTPCAEGARDRRLVSLEVRTTSLQQRQMVQVEEGQFLVDDAVDGAIQLEAFLPVRRASRLGNQRIGLLMTETGVDFRRRCR